MSQHKEIIVGFLIAAALSAGTVAIYLQSKNDAVTQKPKESIQVNANVTPESNEQQALKNQTLNWQKSVAATTTQTNIDGTIYEEIDENQSFSGNLDVPKGWSVEYTCDDRSVPVAERTYSASLPCPLDGVTGIRLNTGTAQTLKPYSQTPLVQPVEEQTVSTGANRALQPILYNNRVYQVMAAVNVQDANSQNDITLNCYDLGNYENCAGFPTYMSTELVSLGQGAKNINTPINMQSYVDDGTYGNKGRLYIPGQTGNSYGVVCVDLEALANCGFTSLGTSGAGVPGNENPVLLSGFVENEGKLYGHANDADRTKQTVVCYDLNSGGNGSDAPCSDYTATTEASTPTYLVSEHNGVYLTTGNHILDDNKLYWIVNYSFRNTNALNAFQPANSQRSWGSTLTCFDLVTKAHCTSWPNLRGGRVFLSNGGGLYIGLERPTTLFAWRNTDNSMKAACVIIGLGAGGDPDTQCYQLPDATLVSDVNGTPGHPAKMFPTQWFFIFWTGSPYVTDITDSEGTKSYIPFYNTATNATNATPARGATFCWNWTTQSVCSGFRQPKYWHEINSGLNGDIGYFYDGSCMWGTGYGGKMWSFNAKTAETPCRVSSTKYTATLNPADFYCDSGNGQLKWGNLRLSKASMYDFQSFNVVVKDASGATVLEQGNIKDDGTLNLSEIEYDEHSQLTVEVVPEVYNTSPWANGNLPFVTIAADAPDAQYCYDTVTKDYCDVNQVTTSTNANVVTDIDTLTGANDTSIDLYQPDNEQCFKDVKVAVTRDKSQIAPGEDITYTAKIDSKANPNNFGRGNIEGAQVEMTIPSNFSLVSATSGGTLSGGKVVWQAQTINAGEFIERKITVRAPNSIASLKEAPKANVVYAATTQTPLTVQAVVIAGDDIFQADNSSQDNSASLVSTSPDPTPEDPGDPDPSPDPTPEDPGDPDPTPTTVDLPDTPDQPQNIAQPELPQNRTPAALRNLLPFALTQPTENIFQAVYSAVSPISPAVASAIPYGTIAFLAAFACVYAYQAIQEARSRRRISVLTARAQQTEAMRRNYLDLTSHYLNTPIATMQNTIDLVKSIGRIPQATAEAAKQRLTRVSQHAQDLLSQSETLTVEAGNTKRAVEASKTKFAFLTPGFLIPVFGVLVVTILLNLVFVWADKYSASAISLGIQASYFVLSAIALAAAYNSFKRQKFATAIAEHELTLEKELSRAQSEFISKSGETLQNDIIELDQLAPAISAAPKGEIFDSGLKSLKGAVSKLTYLNELAARKNQPNITSDTVSELSKSIIAKYSKLATEKNISFKADIQPGLTARVDRDGYTQLLSSTLENAIMFNKLNGSVTLSITRSTQNAIKIVVADTGKGISKDKIKSLFTPFARATDTRQFDFEGFGLDLYMDRLITEQAGGKITIDSEKDKGTTVTITLPS